MSLSVTSDNKYYVKYYTKWAKCGFYAVSAPLSPDQSRCAIAHKIVGMIMLTPTMLAVTRGETPWSMACPDSQADKAITAMQSPKSAAKMRPRNRSSVFSCNNVVENTQTVEPPT